MADFVSGLPPSAGLWPLDSGCLPWRASADDTGWMDCRLCARQSYPSSLGLPPLAALGLPSLSMSYGRAASHGGPLGSGCLPLQASADNIGWYLTPCFESDQDDPSSAANSGADVGGDLPMADGRRARAARAAREARAAPAEPPASVSAGRVRGAVGGRPLGTRRASSVRDARLASKAARKGGASSARNTSSACYASSASSASSARYVVSDLSSDRGTRSTGSTGRARSAQRLERRKQRSRRQQRQQQCPQQAQAASLVADRARQGWDTR